MKASRASVPMPICEGGSASGLTAGAAAAFGGVARGLAAGRWGVVRLAG